MVCAFLVDSLGCRATAFAFLVSLSIAIGPAAADDSPAMTPAAAQQASPGSSPGIVGMLNDWWQRLRAVWEPQVRLRDAADSSRTPTETHAGQRVVPHLQGEREAVARQLLRLLDLEGASGTYYIAPDAWRADLRPGTVAMQTPQAGAMIESGEVVACWTFLPAAADRPIVETPDLRGLPLGQAADRLAETGLRLMRPEGARRADDDARVVDQYPRAQQSVYQGTSVFLQVTGNGKN